ncbi:hypothetical protein L195_g047593, partial [Trifolium pratense]
LKSLNHSICPIPLSFSSREVRTRDRLTAAVLNLHITLRRSAVQPEIDYIVYSSLLLVAQFPHLLPPFVVGKVKLHFLELFFHQYLHGGGGGGG